MGFEEVMFKCILCMVRMFFDCASLCAIGCAKLRGSLSGIHQVAWMLFNYLFPRKKYRLEKIPKHIAVAFTDRNHPPTIDAIADVALYCYIYRIEQLTIYDPWSVLKKQKDSIEMAVVNRFAYNKTNQCLIHVNENVTDNNLESLRINILGADDSFGSLVTVASILSHNYCKDMINLSDITVDVVNNEMGNLNVSQPDLFLQFGQCSSTFGYPPWGLRICELLVCSHETYSTGRFSEMNFLDALETYSKRNQRFGK